MTVYPKSAPRTLSDSHQRMLLEESGISPDVAAERGYYTARSGKDVPQEYGWLPSNPGAVFPVHPLDGGIFCRLRPDKPGRYPKYMQPKGARNRLDVHPRQHGAAKQAGGMRYVTEGEKKVDAGVSRGLLMVGLSGVWNGQKDGELIPDWELLPLAGESYSILFDSDIETNEHVQAAAERQARLLQARGANVYITLLPPAPDGSKQGLDDFFAHGGTVKQLELLTRPYETVVVERVRLTRDQKLRAGVRWLRSAWRDRDWMRLFGKADKGNWQRGHTARDTKAALIGLAAKRGKVDDRGIVVRVGLRRLSELAAKSAPSVGHALKHLEAEGDIEILPAEDRSKARSYRLLVPRAALYSMERGDTKLAESEGDGPRCKGLRAPAAPRLRWSSPARPGRLVRRVEGATGRTITEAVGDNVFVDPEYRPYANRLGPHRGAVLDALEHAGGELHIEELCEVLHRTRPRDVRRRILEPLEEAGIIECEGDVIRLVGEWLARLDDRREEDGEIKQAEKQAKKHKRQRESYRLHLEREKNGTPKASTQAVRRSHELRERRMREAREEEGGRRNPVPPATLALVDRLVRAQRNGRIRMSLLCGVASDEGHRAHDDVPRAVEDLGYRVERLPEFGNERFVFAPAEAVA